MKAVSAITITGYEVAFEVNIHELTSSSYDETIDQVHDAILDGDKSGTVDLGDDVFSWWIKNEKDEEIESLTFKNKMMTEALEAIGFTQEQISQICSGTKVQPCFTDNKFKAYAIATFTSNSEKGAQDYDDFMEGETELSIWEPFENKDEEEMRELVESEFDSVKYCFTPRLVEAKNISVMIKKLDDFKNDEKELLEEYADLIAQDETDPRLVLYSNSLSDILDTLEDDEEYRDSDFHEFKAILNDMIITGADQYIFE
jgi:hypothetical protein